MDPFPLILAIMLSLPTCATQPLKKTNVMSDGSSSVFKSKVPSNEDGDNRFVLPEVSAQKQAEIKSLNGGRDGVKQIETTPYGARFYARREGFFRQNLRNNLHRTFKQSGSPGGYEPAIETYPHITDLQRSRNEFERRKQMALNRFRNPGNNLSNGNKRDQGRGGTFISQAPSFTNQDRLAQRQVVQLPSKSHTGSWAERQPSSSNSNPPAASEKRSGANPTNGQEQEVERQESGQPGASSTGSLAGKPSSAVSVNTGSGQNSGAISTNGQKQEAERQASEHPETSSSSRAGKPPSVVKANSPAWPKQRPQVTSAKVQEQEVENQESESPTLTPSQHLAAMPKRVVSTLSPVWQHHSARSTSTTNESPWEGQVPNSRGTGGSTSNESFENFVHGSTPGVLRERQTTENNRYNAHHDYHYERVERMDRTLRMLSRLGLSHLIPFITLEFIHNHPYALPLPHYPFILDPEYFVHKGNSD